MTNVATPIDHFRQAEDNLELVKLLSSHQQYANWRITVSHYAAIHYSYFILYVRGPITFTFKQNTIVATDPENLHMHVRQLCKKGHYTKPSLHQLNHDILAQHHPSLGDHLKHLHAICANVRYKCAKPKPVETMHVKLQLEEIKEYVYKFIKDNGIVV